MRTTPETAGQLLEQLTTSGYQVDLASNGNEALSQGAAHDYAVITVDRMLPDIDGIAVMRKLRGNGVAAPFLIISALGEVDDKVRGLCAGGDDYLVKPFSYLELLARLEALGRRSDTIAKETILRIGDLAIDLISRTASRRGKEILLLPRELQLLEYLVRNESCIVSRAMLLQRESQKQVQREKLALSCRLLATWSSGPAGVGAAHTRHTVRRVLRTR